MNQHILNDGSFMAQWNAMQSGQSQEIARASQEPAVLETDASYRAYNDAQQPYAQGVPGPSSGRDDAAMPYSSEQLSTSPGQQWQHHQHAVPTSNEGNQWQHQPEWEPPNSVAPQGSHPSRAPLPGSHEQPASYHSRPPEWSEHQHQESTETRDFSDQRNAWQQEQRFYGEAASEPRQHDWEQRVSQQTYDPDAGLSEAEIQQQLYLANGAAAQAVTSQQQQQPIYDAAYEVADFNACATWNGPFPGFVFKLGESGVGYYKDHVSKASSTSKFQSSEPAAKPTVIGSNKSIIKGLTLKSGMIKKKKKDTDLEAGAMPSSAYLREMQAWKKQACSSEKGSGSLVK